MQKINVSNQYAPNSVTKREAFADFNTPVIESALHHVDLEKLSVRTGNTAGLGFCEMPVTGLLVLRAQSDKPALQSALKSTLDLDLPDTLQCSSKAGETNAQSVCVRWVAPDEWMLSCAVDDAFDVETHLRTSINDASVAIVNVTGGYTTFRLSGAHANDVLRKSTGYDVHPSNLMAGKVVNTVFAKAQVTLRCIDINDYEILVRRSFADYLWHWIQVASREYGLSVSVAES